uniref:Uncharacterized protein n=1 Tax=viral metagenome TaxID=1070528 RepID=A0A6M3XMJ9_9ZZZZ
MEEPKTRRERIQFLFDKIFELRKEKLMKMEEYINELKQLAQGEANAREEIKKADKMWEVKKWDAVAKSYVSEKNIIREIRFAVKLLMQEEGKLMAELAELEGGA